MPLAARIDRRAVVREAVPRLDGDAVDAGRLAPRREAAAHIVRADALGGALAAVTARGGGPRRYMHVPSVKVFVLPPRHFWLQQSESA